MVKIREAFPEDFESIYPLFFEEFNLGSKTEKEIAESYLSYTSIFKKHWNSPNQHIGYLLYNDSKIVGFLGYIFSSRTIQEKEYKFCNFSCWAVLEKYRYESILLTMPLKKLKKEGYTLVNLSPSKAAFDVFYKMYKFKILEDSQTIIPFIPYINISDKLKIWKDDKIKIDWLTKQETLDYNNMKNYKASFLFFRVENETCLIVCNKIYKKNIPFTFILHVSNESLFLKNISRLRSFINKSFLTPAIIIDNRLIKNKRIPLSYNFTLKYSKLYWSDQLKENQIDNLYSENLF